MAEKRKRRSYRGCGTTVLCAILLFAIYIVALFLPFFNITNIKVEGNSQIKTETIIKECTIAKGQNILRISPGKAKKSILKMPYAKEVKVKRKLPSQVTITISEEEVAAYILKDGKFIAINESGKVLETAKKAKAGILQIPGMKVTKSEPGENIEYKNESILKLQFDIMAKLSEVKLLKKATKLDMANSSDIKITFDNALVAEIGNSDELEYKIKMIETVIGQGYGSGIFNITNTAQPTYRKNK